MREHNKEALGVPEIRQYEKYLGLPSLVGRNKKASFNYIKERVWKKNLRMERKTIVLGGKGDINEGGGPSYPNIHDELFQTPNGLMFRD